MWLLCVSHAPVSLSDPSTPHSFFYDLKWSYVSFLVCICTHASYGHQRHLRLAFSAHLSTHLYLLVFFPFASFAFLCIPLHHAVSTSHFCVYCTSYSTVNHYSASLPLPILSMQSRLVSLQGLLSEMMNVVNEAHACDELENKVSLILNIAAPFHSTCCCNHNSNQRFFSHLRQYRALQYEDDFIFVLIYAVTLALESVWGLGFAPHYQRIDDKSVHCFAARHIQSAV